MKYITKLLIAAVFTTVLSAFTATGLRADSITLTQSNLELTGSYTTNTEKTVEGITFVYTDLMKSSNNIQAKASSGVIYNTTPFPGTITSVVITHSGTARSTTVLGSSDGTNWTQVATGSGSIDADFSASSYTYFKITRGANAAYWTQIEITYSSGSSTPTCAVPTFSPAQGTYTSAQNVTISTETEGATIYYTLDGTAPTVNSSDYSSAISVSETTTIKAIAVKDGNNNSAVASATYTILEHAGTEADPYTVADARAAIDAGAGVTGVYATGIVSEIVTAWSSQYDNISYNIIDEGGSDVLQVYRGTCNNEDIVRVGDVVVVFGNLSKYNTTYQFSSGSALSSLKLVAPTFSPAAGEVTSGTEVTISNLHTNATTIYYTSDGTEPTSSSTVYSGPVSITSATTLKAIAVKDGYTTSNVSTAAYTINVTPTVTVSSNSIEAPAAGKEGTINVTYDNITTVAADVAFFESDGTTDASYDWIIATVNDSNNVEYLIEENTSSEARSAYMKVWAYDDDLNEVYSELITFTQAGFVVDYATLPFEYDGNGQSTLPTGFTVDGLSTYSSSPKMQFNSSGDWAILKINEAPGKLTFDIKGNSFSGGTFKVQTSADGTTYTDLETYTELGSTQSEEFDNLASTVRYIKWVYTTKSNGNVALGNIKLAKVDTTPAVTLASTTIEATAAETEGTLNVTYKSIDLSKKPTINFFESDGTTSANYAWISASINDDNNVVYTISANDGEARTGYFKVSAKDANDNSVLSALVTVSQEAYVAPAATTTWVKTELSDLSSDDVFLIVGNNGSTYAMSNDNGTSNPPTAEAVTVENNTITAAIADNLQWTIGGNAEDGYTFYVNGSDSWLYCTSTNNGVRVGSNANKTFVIDDGYLKHEGTSRYVGIYNSSDWRCYTTINDNIKDQTFSFYKKAAPQGVESAITLTATLSGGRYWATFYNSDAQYRITNGAQAFTMNEDHELYLLGEDGSVIPAGKAVIIISDTDSVTLTLKNAAGSVTVNGGDNILRGSNSAVAKTGSQYVLGIVDGTLGFYKFTGDYIPANKAYYE